MFYFIVYTIIWQISLFATHPSTYIYDIDIVFVYLYFVYSIYIQDLAG